ncbi:hypothetical protein LCGC14_0262420 [marine sediment metagenome]|uniref:Uncharacterized protein n=1 Tax=marine sediment metagenome TaxID=412755 RepID=A0A0F9X5W9_9ZZZZ
MLKDRIMGVVLALCLFTFSVPLIWLLGGGRWGFAWQEITELVFSCLGLLFAIFAVIYFYKRLLSRSDT